MFSRLSWCFLRRSPTNWLRGESFFHQSSCYRFINQNGIINENVTDEDKNAWHQNVRRIAPAASTATHEMPLKLDTIFACECTQKLQRRRKSESKGWQTLLRRFSLIVTHNFSRVHLAAVHARVGQKETARTASHWPNSWREIPPRSRSVPIASIQASIPVLSWIFRFFSSSQGEPQCLFT